MPLFGKNNGDHLTPYVVLIEEVFFFFFLREPIVGNLCWKDGL